MASYGVTNASIFIDVRNLPLPVPRLSRPSYQDEGAINQSVAVVVTIATGNDAGETPVSVASAACRGDGQLYSTPTSIVVAVQVHSVTEIVFFPSHPRQSFQSKPLMLTPTTVVLALVFTLFAVVTIAGNTLVIAAFATDRKLRSFGNYFILNLAVSDLVVGLLIAVYAPYALSGCWRLTRTGCLAFLLLDYVVPLASAWNMALVSLDRYWSVAHAVEYRVRQNVSRAVALMAVPWTAGVVWYGPTVLFWSVFVGRAGDDDESVCRVPFYDHVGYLIASSCVEFAAPFVTVTTINILIYVNIHRRSRSLVSAAARSDFTAANGDLGLCSKTSKARTILLRDKRSARSLAILVVVFLVTWAPFEISAFVDQICGLCIPGSVSEIVFWLLWLNSTINPVLYPFLQQRFRVTFLRILGRLFTLPSSSSFSWTTTSTAAHRAQAIYVETEDRDGATSVC